MTQTGMGSTGADLAGRVALITGGARGIGLATARALAHGATVALADLDIDHARAAARAIPHAAAFAVDVSDRNAFAELLGAVEGQLGYVDVLVNNAAVMAAGPLLEIGERQVRRMVEVNLIGVIHGMQLVLPGMLARGQGHLINLASAAGKWGVPGENIHCATKFAVVGLSEIARRELRGTPARISVVLPGPVSTELAGGMRSNLAIRMISPETVAAAITAAVIRPRFEVWVPRWLGWLETANHLLPRALREPAQQAFGLDRVATNIDRPRRAEYEQRTFGEPASGAPSSQLPRPARPTGG